MVSGLFHQASNQKLLSHRLEGEGYRVVLSATGQEALDYLKTNPIDLILLDIMLPGMDGEHVLQILQADRALKHIPVIMISALDEQESVRRCLQMGARDYLLKPFDPHQLHQCICMHLAARPISSTAVEAV
jgi:CheY-like chemotaxis protein